MSTLELSARLKMFYREKYAADALGYSCCEAYMADLDALIAECRHALMLTALTEIATFHGELFGRAVG